VSSTSPLDVVGCNGSRAILWFRKLGLINYNGHIEVHSVLLNAVLHDKPQLKEDQ